MVSLAEKRKVVTYLKESYSVSERRACLVANIARSSYRYPPSSAQQADLVKRISELSYQYSRFGYRKIHTLLLNEGFKVSRETVRIIRKREGLQVKKKGKKKRLLGKSTTQLNTALFPNHVWSYDFVHDSTADGRTLKFLTVVDEFTHEGLMIETNRSLTSSDVKRCLKFLFSVYGAPVCIKSDNGPEFVAKEIQRWLKEKHVKTRYIDPGSPWQNGTNESFNGVFRDGCLDRWEFYSLSEARRVVDQWLTEYNEIRPHGSIKQMTPRAFADLHRQPAIKAA